MERMCCTPDPFDPLEKTRAFGMTPSKDCSPSNNGGAGVGLSGGKVGMIWHHHN